MSITEENNLEQIIEEFGRKFELLDYNELQIAIICATTMYNYCINSYTIDQKAIISEFQLSQNLERFIELINDIPLFFFPDIIHTLAVNLRVRHEKRQSRAKSLKNLLK